MGNVILSDTDSTGLAIYTTQRDNPVGFVKGSVNNLPELLDDAGNVLTGPTMSCVKIDSSTTRLETGTDVRPNRADFRGNHILQCTLSGATLQAANVDNFQVHTTGTCADRTFPLKNSASTVQENGKFSFQPLEPVDTCPDGRKTSEKQPVQVRVTMKGDVKDVYENYRTTPAMVHTYDLPILASHTPPEFNLGIQNPRAAYLKADACPGDALCIGGASYEFLDSNGDRIHITTQNSSVGFTFDGTDYKYTKPGIQVNEKNPRLKNGTNPSSAVFELIQNGNRNLTLDESIDCVFTAGLGNSNNQTIPLTELFPLTTTQNILDECTDRMVSTVEITCDDTMTPNLGSFEYDKANEEFREAPTVADGWYGSDLQSLSHTLESVDVSTGTTVVSIVKPDSGNMELNKPIGFDTTVVTDVDDSSDGNSWLVTIEHGIDFKGLVTETTRTITVSGSYFPGCIDDGSTDVNYNVAITFSSQPVWKTPVLRVASRDQGQSVRQRFMKWQITNVDDVDGALFEKPTGAFWCLNGDDDINSCHDGARNANELYLYLQGTTGCEGLSRDAIAKRLEFTVPNADVFGTSPLPCPPPQGAITLDTTVLDWTVDFTVNGTNTTISLPTAHSMDNHGIISEDAYLGSKDNCNPDGTSDINTDTDCALEIDNTANVKDYVDLNNLLVDSKCGSYLINHVQFEDVRRNKDGGIETSVVDFCNVKQLSVGILAQSDTKEASFGVVQTGGVEADLKMTNFGWEACTGEQVGQYLQVMDMTYIQRGVHQFAPQVETEADNVFKKQDSASGIQFKTGCAAICQNSAHAYYSPITTAITFTWQATESSVQSTNTFSISTHLKDSPCSENVDADDASLLTPFELKVEKKQENSACPASLTGGDNIAEYLRQNDVVCIEFVGVKPDNTITRLLDITGVSLVDNVLGEGQKSYDLDDGGDLTVGTNKGYDLHATKAITSDMVEKNFTLTVSYTENYEFGGRRRLRSVFQLGNKLHDADASFTVLPSHITVQDSEEESAPDAAEDAAEDAADAAESKALTAQNQ